MRSPASPASTRRWCCSISPAGATRTSRRCSPGDPRLRADALPHDDRLARARPRLLRRRPAGRPGHLLRDSGEHGGNMDYRGFREGVTVDFPVFAEGALLHVGDGHALQGDGEIVGTGIEVSMDVELSVEVLT